MIPFRISLNRPGIRVLIAASFLMWAAQSLVADDADNANSLSGTWKLIAVEINGEVRQLDDDVRWAIEGSRVLYGGEPLATVTNYPDSNPKGIDVAFTEPKAVYEGIYVLDGKELKICLNARTGGIKDRPFDFATKDKPDLRVVTFERLAPADAAHEARKGFIGMALAIENEAVVISNVIEKSPAEKAGLRAGDVLLMIGNDKVRDLQGTVDTIRQKSPGTNVVVRVRRDDKEQEIAVKIAVFPFSLLGILG